MIVINHHVSFHYHLEMEFMNIDPWMETVPSQSLLLLLLLLLEVVIYRMIINGL